MKSGIYKITNTKNGKFYIGSTKGLSRRKKQHFTTLRQGKNHCKVLQRAYNKYGEFNFTFEVLAYCPEIYLFKLEQWFVDNLKPQYNTCLIDVSVPIGYVYTEEDIEFKRKEAIRRHLLTTNFGWKSRTLEQLDELGNVIQEFTSLKEYSAKYNCSIGNVGVCLRKGNKCKGFNIRYK